MAIVHPPASHCRPFTELTVPLFNTSIAQWFEQIGQSIVVNLVHQAEQSSDFSLWHTLSHKPAQIIARQIGNQSTFVLTKRHGPCDQQLQIVGIQFSRQHA